MSRISALPLRSPDMPDATTCAAVTDWLRSPGGAGELRPIQAMALLELAQVGGLFCAARVGAGKTLISALAPTVCGAKRPLLLVPANLKTRAGDPKGSGKTEREFAALRANWQMPSEAGYRIESYQKLGRKGAADLLERYNPDLIVCDEAHKLKNKHVAACARRFHRFCAANRTKLVILSGTPARQSITDYAPLLSLALGSGAPVPTDPDLLDEWAAVLDDKPTKEWIQPDISILWPHLGPCETLEQARTAYQHRLRWTHGVIISTDCFDGVPLIIRPLHSPPPAALDEAFERLRGLMVMPDDWPLADESRGVWAAAQQLALGFYYYHDPRPPEEWMQARREWCGFCRRVLESSTEWDSELQVREACRAGRLPSGYLDTWETIQPTFTPVTKVSWLSTHALEVCEQWGQGGGIIWVTHTAFALELARRTGWRYYGAGGVDATGAHVDQATDWTIIVSAKSSTEGRNLQWHHHRVLLLIPPKTALDWEQRVGRTFRDGQKYPVEVDYYVGCVEQWVALPCALALAEAARAREGQAQILLGADLVEPSVGWLVGPAFVKP